MQKNSINKKTGFKVPKNYFEDLDNVFLSEIKLKVTSSSPGFNIPTNYFESFNDKIIESIEKEKEVKVIKLFSWRSVAYASSIAASFMLLFNIFFNNSENLNIDALETATIENYMINEGFEANEMALLFSNEDLSEVNIIKNNFSSETLENYVFDNLEIEDIFTK